MRPALPALYAVAILSLGSSALSAAPAAQNAFAAASAAAADEQLGRSVFRAGVLDGCMSKAPKALESGYDISPTCTCAADTLSANITDAELKQLETARPESLDAKIQATIQSCLESTPPVPARQ